MTMTDPGQPDQDKTPEQLAAEADERARRAEAAEQAGQADVTGPSGQDQPDR
jgi:hypothetical protein